VGAANDKPRGVGHALQMIQHPVHVLPGEQKSDESGEADHEVETAQRLKQGFFCGFRSPKSEDAAIKSCLISGYPDSTSTALRQSSDKRRDASNAVHDPALPSNFHPAVRYQVLPQFIPCGARCIGCELGAFKHGVSRYATGDSCHQNTVG
jgi:hypothetical protein